MNRIVDDILCRFDVQVEHVIATGPSRAHIIGRGGRTVNANQMLVDPLQQLVAKRQSTLAAHSISGVRDSAIPEAHILLSSGRRGTPQRRQTITGPSGPGVY